VRRVIEFMCVVVAVGTIVMAGVGTGVIVSAVFTAPRPEYRVSSVLPVKDYSFVFQDEGRTVVAIDEKGEVTFGEGVTLTEASRAFWEAVGKDHCEVCYAVEVEQ
jgi:hypothetical protein